MKKYLSIAVAAALGLTGCLRLDSNLYNSSKLTEYKLDAYTGEKDMELDASYHIPDSLIHLFTLRSDDNGDTATIYAIYIGDINRIDTDTVIVYCHGNKDHMDLYWNRAKLLAHVGWKNRFGVLMMDYRGYGMSTGTTTETGMYADVNTCLQWLKDQGLTGDRLCMYGFSMGSASATELTANPTVLTPSWLALEAPFASSEVMVQDAARLAMPASFFTNLKIDNAEEIKKVQQPFLWLHGEADDFLSIETHGAVVAANYQGTRKIVRRVLTAGHSSVPQTMGFDNYTASVLELIRPF